MSEQKAAEVARSITTVEGPTGDESEMMVPLEFAQRLEARIEMLNDLNKALMRSILGIEG